MITVILSRPRSIIQWYFQGIQLRFPRSIWIRTYCSLPAKLNQHTHFSSVDRPYQDSKRLLEGLSCAFSASYYRRNSKLSLDWSSLNCAEAARFRCWLALITKPCPWILYLSRACGGSQPRTKSFAARLRGCGYPFETSDEHLLVLTLFIWFLRCEYNFDGSQGYATSHLFCSVHCPLISLCYEMGSISIKQSQRKPWYTCCRPGCMRRKQTYKALEAILPSLTPFWYVKSLEDSKAPSAFTGITRICELPVKSSPNHAFVQAHMTNSHQLMARGTVSRWILLRIWCAP